MIPGQCGFEDGADLKHDELAPASLASLSWQSRMALKTRLSPTLNSATKVHGIVSVLPAVAFAFLVLLTRSTCILPSGGSPQPYSRRFNPPLRRSCKDASRALRSRP